MSKPYVIEDWKRLKSLGWNVPEGGILPRRPTPPPAPPKPPAEKVDKVKETT